MSLSLIFLTGGSSFPSFLWYLELATVDMSQAPLLQVSSAQQNLTVVCPWETAFICAMPLDNKDPHLAALLGQRVLSPVSSG